MNTFGLLLFFLALGLFWSRNMSYSVWFLAGEGVLLSLMVWTSKPITTVTILVGLATLVVKGGLIPTLLHRLLRTLPAAFRRDHPMPLWAYGTAVLVVLAVSHVIHLLGPTGVIRHTLVFFYALASIHVGFVMIVARRHLLAQLASLVAIENGLVLLAVSLTGTLPTFIELGLLVDLSLAAILMVWLSHRIHHKMQTTDVITLRRLRG